jgi:hypothetical protein
MHLNKVLQYNSKSINFLNIITFFRQNTIPQPYLFSNSNILIKICNLTSLAEILKPHQKLMVWATRLDLFIFKNVIKLRLPHNLILNL